MPEIQIAASILSADLGALNSEIRSIESACNWIHFDVMDGHFVPNISMGPCVLKGIKSSLPVDCHLMIDNPEQYLDEFAEAGARSISVHFEACPDIPKVLKQIRNFNMRTSLAIKPGTPVEVLDPYLDQLEMVLIMSVEPGFSGQKFMKNCLPKIRYIRERYPKLDIEVDGGINDQTAPLVIQAGANILVSASYLFEAANRLTAIKKLRNEPAAN